MGEGIAVTTQQNQNGALLGTVMSMDEIRERRGMPVEEFCASHPWWEWTEARLGRRMIDSQGRAWVAMWDTEYGVGISYEPELTPQAEVFIAELARRAREEILAGGGDVFDYDAPDD